MYLMRRDSVTERANKAIMGTTNESEGLRHMENLRVGIIGCGGIANSKHLPSLKELGGVDVVAFCDLVLDRARKPPRNTAPRTQRSLKTTRTC